MTSPHVIRFPVVGPRIVLRPFGLADVLDAHCLYGDGEGMRWVGDGVVAQASGTEAMLREYIAHQREHGFSVWAIVERESRTLVGDAGLYVRAEGEVELGYTLRREWWGLGYATEAGRLCVSIAFDQLQLGALCALVDVHNQNSMRVRQARVPAAGRCAAYGRDHVVYRLRSDDWGQNR